MKSLVFLSVFVLAAVSIRQGACLTNRDFYDFVRAYGQEIDAGDDTETTLALPGGLDDDLDIEYLVRALGLQATKQNSGVGLWFHHHHHHHHHRPEFHCTCTKDDCKCCITHNFHFFVTHYKLEACMVLVYDPDDHKFQLDFTLNGKSVYKHEVSLDHVAHLCFKVPGLENLAEVCLELYDVDLSRRHACARLTGIIDLKVHKFKVHLKLGCFSVPTSEHLSLSGKDLLTVEVLPKTAESESTDMPDRFRKLAEENSEDEEEEIVDDTLRFEY